MGLMIHNKRNRYIVPFGYEVGMRNLEEITASIDEVKDEFGGKFVQDRVNSNEQDIYQYVLESFSDIGKVTDQNCGSIFRYVKSTDSKEEGILNLRYIAPANNDNSMSFIIKDMGLFLFDSGVGFLWYELGASKKDKSFLDMTTEDLIVFNNIFKELNYQNNKDKIKASNYDEFYMGDYIARVLRNIDGVRYYGHRVNIVKKSNAPKIVPDKALLFNYVHINRNSNLNIADWNTELTEVSYYLSKGYKRSYEMPENINEVLYKPFKNTFWYVSKEGAGYYVISDDNSNNRTFFSKGMNRKVMDDYFLIYVLALHQSYTMLLFAEEISNKLPSSAQIYTNGLNKIDDMVDDDEYRFKVIEETLGEIVTKVNVFITKSIRASISYVGHQNEFFRYAKEQLSVDLDIENVTHGLEALQEIVHSSRQNWEDLQEKRRDDKLNYIVGILSIVAFVSAIYDGLCLINEFFLSEETHRFVGSTINSVGIVRLFFCLFILIFIGVMVGVGRVVFPTFDSLSKTLIGKFHWKKEKKYRQLQKQNEELFDKYNKDEMTGIYNRAGKEFYSKLMLTHAKKHHKDIYVCVGDLNGLKHINDTYGHEHGGLAITTASSILANAVNGYGKAFRTGGDEFLLIAEFPRGNDKSNEIEKKIYEGMEKFNSAHTDLPYKVKISFGHEIRKASTNLKDLNEMIRIANQRMYAMKQETDEYKRD